MARGVSAVPVITTVAITLIAVALVLALVVAFAVPGCIAAIAGTLFITRIAVNAVGVLV